MDELSDETLIARWQAEQQSGSSGDQWLDELFGRHYERVSLWCLRFAGSRDAAADLAQEVFTNAYRSLGTFRRDCSFTTWLYTITRHQCINAIRARAVRTREDRGSLDLENIRDANAPDPDLKLDEETSTRVLQRLLRECLNETERRVIVLHYVAELPLDSITRLLGLRNTSGAKAYVVSARRKLSRAVRRGRSLAGFRSPSPAAHAASAGTIRRDGMRRSISIGNVA